MAHTFLSSGIRNNLGEVTLTPNTDDELARARAHIIKRAAEHGWPQADLDHILQVVFEDAA